MPDTGLFYVVDVESVLDEQGRIAYVSSLAYVAPAAVRLLALQEPNWKHCLVALCSLAESAGPGRWSATPVWWSVSTFWAMVVQHQA